MKDLLWKSPRICSALHQLWSRLRFSPGAMSLDRYSTYGGKLLGWHWSSWNVILELEVICIVTLVAVSELLVLLILRKKWQQTLSLWEMAPWITRENLPADLELAAGDQLLSILVSSRVQIINSLRPESFAKPTLRLVHVCVPQLWYMSWGEFRILELNFSFVFGSEQYGSSIVRSSRLWEVRHIRIDVLFHWNCSELCRWCVHLVSNCHIYANRSDMCPSAERLSFNWRVVYQDQYL